MDIGLDYRYLHAGADARERAEELVRNGWPEMRRPFYGAQEEKLMWEGRQQGVGVRKAAANARTASARNAIEEVLMRYRLDGQVPPEEELRPLKDDLARSQQSEAAADAEVAAINTGLQAATYVANKLVITMAEWSIKGVRLRKKLAKLGRGDLNEQLKSALGRILSLRNEITRIRNAGTPVSLLKVRLGEELDKLFAKDAFRLRYSDGTPNWVHPVLPIPAEHKLSGRDVVTDDLLPLMLSLFGDEIRARLMARVDRDHRGDTTLRLEAGEKKKRLATLQDQLSDLYREEAALRVLLAGDALEIAFRPETDVAAILGVELIN